MNLSERWKIHNNRAIIKEIIKNYQIPVIFKITDTRTIFDLLTILNNNRS